MGSRTIGRVPQAHVCQPGVEWRDHTADPADPMPLPSGRYAHFTRVPVGTVQVCDECGQWWEAVKNRNPGNLMPAWERVGWLRRRRLERELRTDG